MQVLVLVLLQAGLLRRRAIGSSRAGKAVAVHSSRGVCVGSKPSKGAAGDSVMQEDGEVRAGRSVLPPPTRLVRTDECTLPSPFEFTTTQNIIRSARGCAMPTQSPARTNSGIDYLILFDLTKLRCHLSRAACQCAQQVGACERGNDVKELLPRGLLHPRL